MKLNGIEKHGSSYFHKRKKEKDVCNSKIMTCHGSANHHEMLRIFNPVYSHGVFVTLSELTQASKKSDTAERLKYASLN
jgi:hypothetical protein